MSPSPEAASQSNSPETYRGVPAWSLIQEDLEWIRAYLPEEGAAEAAFDTINTLGVVGSIPLRLIKDEQAKVAALEARASLLKVLGIDEETIDSARNKNHRQRAFIIPSSSFIEAQRTLHKSGADMQKMPSVYKSNSSLLAYSSKNWNERYEKMRAIFTEDMKGDNPNVAMSSIILRYPRAMNSSSATLEEHIAAVTALGISPKAIQRQPSMLSLNSATLERKIDMLTEAGYDPISIFNRAPTVTGMAATSIMSRIEHLTQLGLDAQQVVERFPGILTSAEATLAKKMAFITRTLQFLEWEGDTVELINKRPSILSASQPKLRLMARILANGAHPSRKHMTVSRAVQSSIIPVDSYIIALGSDERFDPGAPDTDVINCAKSITNVFYKRGTSRAEAAKKALPTLRGPHAGKIALMYSRSKKN